MKWQYLVYTLVCLFVMGQADTNNCYEGEAYSGCYYCYDSYDYCIDCGWFYNADCLLCDCGGVSSSGIAVIVISIFVFICCCVAIGRQRRRRYYRRNGGLIVPINQGPPPRTYIANVQQPVSCICGSAMIQGQVQQGQPKCANVNCAKDIMAMAAGSCYYCPNTMSTNVHPNGFFYCTTCAIAVQRAGGAQIVKQPQQQPTVITTMG
eukprot:85080_1